MLERIFGILLITLMCHFQYPSSTNIVYGQSSVQEALSQQNLTLQQARVLARQAGVNPDNPAELSSFARANGVSEEQIQAWLNELGLDSGGEEGNSGQVLDLRDTSITQDEVSESSSSTITYQNFGMDETVTEEGLSYYGYDIFKNIPEAFEPNKLGPVDDGYIIGPEDEMRLTVWGTTEFQYELEVDAEGRIFIPTIGQFTVAGQTLKDFREQLRLRLSQSYSGLMKDPPTMFLDVTLTRLRPIRVFVIGEVEKPGGYTFSSYSSLFNVLYGIGGPTENGSLRDIRLIRNGKIVSSFDFYKFLMEGIDSGSIKLQNNDRIFIPKRLNSIRLRGPVMRQAIYELKEGEGFNELLDYAGGLNSDAYGKRFQVERIIPLMEREDPSIARKVIDYNLIDVLRDNSLYNITDDDKIQISNISDRIEDIAFVSGAVFQPGRYEINDQVNTTKDLVLAADSIKGDAFLYQAELVRTNEDLTQTFFALNVENILNGVPGHDIPLKRLDRLRIFSRTDLEENYSVSLTGAVDETIEVRWKENLTVFDLLFKGKGLFDPQVKERIYLKRADLRRLSENGRNSNVIPFNLEEALNNEGFGKELLQPGDRIRIFPNTIEVIENKFVIIEGRVKNPGTYELNENMTLEDLLIIAGGFTELSFLGKVEVSRLVKSTNNQAKAVQFFWPLLDNSKENNFFTPDLSDTLLKSAGKYKLQHRDRIYIRTNPYFEQQKTVKILGELVFPGKYTILKENETIYDLIQRAGGITSEGYPKGARYYRQGEMVLFDFDEIVAGNKKSNIEILPGDSIVVPRQPGSVFVTGNVGLQVRIKHNEGQKLSYYLDRAGGMQKNSYKYVQLTQANGMQFEVKRKGLFKQNPQVESGAKINVIYEEPKPQRERMRAGEVLQTAVATLTSTLTIIILIDRAFQ